MKIQVLKESGYEEATLGFSLSYNSTIDRAKQLLPKYAFGIPGENKFLESIYIWLDVIAPRFWWQEADTYRVGTSKQSESTMHTLCKREVTRDDFEYAVTQGELESLNSAIRFYKTVGKDSKDLNLAYIKSKLPEGFLQRRIWCLNYKCLQNIYNQRYNHKLPQWKYFCTEILNQIEYPEFIVKRSLYACTQQTTTGYTWQEVE